MAGTSAKTSPTVEIGYIMAHRRRSVGEKVCLVEAVLSRQSVSRWRERMAYRRICFTAEKTDV